MGSLGKCYDDYDHVNYVSLCRKQASHRVPAANKTLLISHAFRVRLLKSLVRRASNAVHQTEVISHTSLVKSKYYA